MSINSHLSPELLRTKQSPEQELKEDRVCQAVQPMIRKIPCDEKGLPNEKEAGVGVVTVRSLIYRYNSSIDEAVAEILGGVSRARLKRQSDATVLKFSSVSKKSKASPAACDMMSYLHTGRREESTK